MIRSVKCPICGKEFLTTYSKAKYCGDKKCKKEGQRRLKYGSEEKECIICGKKFIGPGKCCSTECRLLNADFNPYAENEPVYKTREVCKVEKEARNCGLSYGYYVGLRMQKRPQQA